MGIFPINSEINISFFWEYNSHGTSSLGVCVQVAVYHSGALGSIRPYYADGMSINIKIILH